MQQEVSAEVGKELAVVVRGCLRRNRERALPGDFEASPDLRKTVEWLFCQAAGALYKELLFNQLGHAPRR